MQVPVSIDDNGDAIEFVHAEEKERIPPDDEATEAQLFKGG